MNDHFLEYCGGYLRDTFRFTHLDHSTLTDIPLHINYAKPMD